MSKSDTIKIMPLSSKKQPFAKDEKGQSLIEFVLLMLVLVLLSYSLLKGFNWVLADRWKALIGVVANPTDTPIEL